MKFSKVNGITLHFSDTGVPGGPVLVFVNSLGTDFRVWELVFGAFESRFRVIRYDKRGHGLSSAPPPPYTMQDHVDDLRTLLDLLAVDEVIICGVSVGGLIAQGFCAQQPERVRALVLCDTAAKIGTEELWNDRIEKVMGEEGITAISESVLERWFTKEFRAHRKDELEGWRNMLVRTPANGYAGTSAAIRDTDLTESTRRISVPALILCGDQDGATPPEVTRTLVDLIPDSRFVLVEDAGHLPSVEQPEVVIGSMNAFFGEKSLV